MSYKKDFLGFQKKYIETYPEALRLRHYLPKDLSDKKVLDVGCGPGLDMEYMVTLGAKDIKGVDASEELATEAREYHNDLDIITCDFSHIPYEDNRFDIVWSKYAINCANSVKEPLSEMYRVCREGGTVLLQVTHPLRTLGLLKSKDYFNSGEIIEYPTLDDKKLIEPHHTISEWINTIIEVGFFIETTEEIINKPKEKYIGVITPSAIIFILKK